MKGFPKAANVHKKKFPKAAEVVYSWRIFSYISRSFNIIKKTFPEAFQTHNI
jgi:hypothetical protein